MIHNLIEKKRFHESFFLLISTLCCFSFSVFRMQHTGSASYFFLNWNLFLAFIPWALTSMAILYPRFGKGKLSLALLLLSWLLFFPNAPYILTDLFHLRHNSTMPIWYDMVQIMLYAWTGLVYGFLSLRDIEHLLSKHLHSIWLSVLSVALLFLSSFGIYLGRYLRWNSWDIITEPGKLISDIADRIINPLEHPATWGMTIVMGVLLSMMYFSFKLIRNRNSNQMFIENQ